MYLCDSKKILWLAKVGMLRWRAQVRKFILVAPQRKLRSKKAQLRSLRFKLLDATFNRNFYFSCTIRYGMACYGKLSNYLLLWVFLLSSAFYALKINFLWKLAFLAFIVSAPCTLNSLKSAIALFSLRSLSNCALILRRNVFKVTHPPLTGYQLGYQILCPHDSLILK